MVSKLLPQVCTVAVPVQSGVYVYHTPFEQVPRHGTVSSVALPALLQAQDYQDRAARVGFDWPEIEGVLEKIIEESQEVRQATNQQELAAELGDLIFSLVNLARWKKVDAESALRGTNMRFKQRIAHLEAGAKKQARNLSDLSIAEMEALWQEAKTVAKD